MKDLLQDLLEHSYALGCIDLIKIEGSDTETLISGLAGDRSVVLQGKFLTPVDEFKGTFGMPNMSTLKTILGIDEYNEDATIKVKRDKDGNPVGMHFENKGGDFKNDYRFMVSNVVEDLLKTVKFKGANWNVELEPSVAGLMRLRNMAASCPNEETFIMKTEDGDLKCYFGDHSTNAGSFVFAPDINGTLKREWHWPVGHVINILSLGGDKTMRVSDDGATEITVNSGLAEYTYILPAQTK